MSLPEIETIEHFLSSVSLTKEKPNESYLEFCAPRVLPDGSKSSTIYLCYSEDEMTLESFVKRIQDVLKCKNSPSDRNIAIAVLGIIAESRNHSSSSITHANNVLDQFVDAKLHIHEIMGSGVLDNPDFEGKVNNVQIKTFKNSKNHEKILWWADRCNVSFPSEFLKIFSGKVSLNYVEEVRLLDFVTTIGKSLFSKWKDYTELFLDEYYNKVLLNVRQDAFSKFNDEISLLEATGFGTIDLKYISESVGTSNLGLFCWKQGSETIGWSLCQCTYRTINLPPADKFVNLRKLLNQEFTFKALNFDIPLDNSIDKYCKILQRAERHKTEERWDEEFLFRVIALDLLYSDKGNCEDICTRSSCVTHKQLNLDFEDLKKKLKKLYDMRSRFVHSGTFPNSKDSKLLRDVTIESLWCLLDVSGKNKFEEIKHWLSEIDLIYHTINTGKVPSEQSFENLGVSQKSLSSKKA